MGDLFLRLLSFFLALAFYGLLVLWLLLFLHQSQAKKIQIKADAIDVMIETKKEAKKQPPKPVAKPTKPKPKPQAKKSKNEGSKSPKAVRSKEKSIKDLFASINARRTTTKKTTAKRPANTPSRKKGERKSAKKLVENLKLQDFTLQDSRKSLKSVEGDVDPYLEKVYKILYENWIPSKLSAGSWAKVRMTIDIDGSISYEVVQWSENENFNEELREYLEYISTLTFPKPPEGSRKFTVRIEAKE